MDSINDQDISGERSNEEIELEGQFIMRVPEDRAETIHKAIRDGNVHKKLSIAMNTDLRHGEVWLEGSKLHTKLVDLPSIVESYKTSDKKKFYKVADISQMLICTEQPQELECKSSDSEEETANKLRKSYLYPHGVTRPLKNMRKRRFRKKMLKTPEMPAADVAQELKYLLTTDSLAESYKYEFVDESDDIQ